MRERGVNLDANATFGLPARVAAELSRTINEFDLYLNPSSVHSGGQRARAQIEGCREQLLELLRLKDRAACFTSGATEANNQLLNHLAKSVQSKKISIVTSAVEHPCILESISELGRKGAEIKLWRPEKYRWDLDKFARLIEPTCDLVTVMSVNNETGEIFPIDEIAKIVRKQAPKALLHTDASQALGRVTLDFKPFDLVTISGHKFGALPGVGALIYPKSLNLNPMILGGAQERRTRAGTENLLGILSLKYAVDELVHHDSSRHERMSKNRDLLWKQLASSGINFQRFASNLAIAPNTLSIRIPNLLADDLVVAADLRGVYISTGAACSSGKQLPSHVLMAHGMTDSEARECIRISLRGDESAEDLEYASTVLIDLIRGITGGVN